MLKRVVPTALLLLLAPVARAQTIEDDIMMPKGTLCTGFGYGYDSWTDYWEGKLKRENGNVGTVSTQAVMWMGNYGITNKLDFIAMMPYIKTHATGGTLQEQKGFQDLTLAAKYSLLSKPLKGGTLRTIAVASYAFPVTDYTVDLLPLSLGSGSQRFSGRLTMSYQSRPGAYLTATGAYTWRQSVTLDRPAYFTNGQLFLTDEVAMPNVIDYSITLGLRRGGFDVPLTYTQQTTQGGGDIRRQDMPFVSNRMNASRLSLGVSYVPSAVKNLTLKVGGGYTASGRNVGQSSVVAASLLYAFHF